jgi:hypothetical protein
MARSIRTEDSTSYNDGLAGSGSSGSVVSAAAAVTSVIAAMSCCLPTGALLASSGLAGASAFFSSAQPYLLGFSVLCLVWGFVQAARAKSCPPRRRKLNLAVLSLSALLVVPVLAFPQPTAAWLADTLFSHPRPPGGQPSLEKFDTGRLRQLFNDAAGRRRVIAMFSPT